MSLFTGEDQCCTEQPGLADLPDEDGQVYHGQSDPVSGEICKLLSTPRKYLSHIVH